MSGYERILQDLDVVEADDDKPTGFFKFSLKKKIQYLRQLLMFIIPFWDSRMWETPFHRQKEEDRLLMEGRLQYLKDGTKFIDYWLQKVRCPQHSFRSSSCCVFHSAEYFYSCSTVEEGEYDWVKCTERVVQVLDFVQKDETIIAFDMSYQFETIKEPLVLLRCFHNSMANWDFDCLEQTRTITGEMFQHMEDLPRRVMRVFKLFQLFNSCDEEFLQHSLSPLAEKIQKCVSDWRKFRKLNVPKLSLEYPIGMEYETLLCFTDDLQNLVISLYDDLPPQIVQDIRVIQEQLADYKKALIPTWIKIFVESGISYVISKNIYILADDAYNALLVSPPSEEALDLKIIYAQQRIVDIRDDLKKIYSNYQIGDFLKFARLILEDDVLCNTPTTNLLEELTLLHTFIINTKNLFHLNTELQDRYLQIEVQFYNAWWKLWSLLREFKCRKDFLTLSLDIIKDITANMPHPTDLLLDLIKTVVQMPEANELLHELRESIATMEDDKLFVKLLYSLGKNLVETFKMEGAVDVIKDVEIGVIEAARIYILFFRESKDDDCPSTVETVKGFEASLRHAYTKFVDLPMSELEFYDMLVNLKEFGETDTYISVRIGGLCDDLSFWFSFLQRHAMRHERDEEVKQLWTQMMKLGRKVDNMIDTLKEFPNWFNKLRVFYVSEEGMLIKEKLLKFSSTDTSKTEVEILDANDEKKTEKGEANSKDEVNFEEEDSLRTQLTKGSKSLEKISIVGMPGLGKTTLAMSLYKSCAKSFDAKAWCYVGQEFQRKDLLRDITGQISERTSSEINAMGVEGLAKLLKQSLLKKKNYLIVLDDVWDIEAWNALQICFPTGNTGSRILLTSRYKTVGEKVCGDKNVLELNLLSPDKSWHLLENKVFGTKSCPDKLCEVGKGIAKKCGGLPLSIVMIAGVLKNKDETEDSWGEVEQSLDDYLLNGGLNTLELSYKHLSIRMKQCFLYCRAFSKGREIPKSKLVRLWLAERFVENADEQESLEGAAEKYLVDLVDRSLLMVSKRSFDNRIQSCRIHDLLRDFCVQKANEEKFLITVDRWDDPASHQLRGRVCFSSTQDQFMLFKSDEGLTQSGIRSLICPITSQRRFNSLCPMSFIFENFKSLTLLDLEILELDSTFCESVSGLKLLRYLALRGWMKSIPSSIGELRNLETLVVNGIRGEVDVPYTIFNLSKLRHLLVNKRASVAVDHSYPNSLSSLQSFSTPVLSRDAGFQIIARLPNLRKLRCIFLDEHCKFSFFDCLCYLESLRVYYCGFGRFCGKLSFPSSLTKLTLSKFKLPWSEIDKIAVLLPRLEILKLLFKAFEGQLWSTADTFKNLKYLRMEELDIKEWEASEDNFPRLERLVVRRCKLLQTIPEDFGNIGDLMGIEAYWCDVSLVKSVLKIKREQIDCGNMKFETIINPNMLDLNEDDELSD
ncbi:putative late blight resistance protein homolog R1A-4 [Silene latifolia]|uniref:putative late blight resistance protein homolog R1A-4 n=1 Tax=Silene latifolia TaxID=37657 RepID=UPI003D776436